MSEGCHFCVDKKAWPEVALGFHHVFPQEKSFAISRSHTRVGLLKVQQEIEKCIVVCHNHHAMLEAGLLEFDAEGWRNGH